MAINPLFNLYHDTDQQNLVQDIIIESIQIYGMDIVYAPKDFVARDLLIGEDPQKAFTSSFTIEMYCDSFGGFGGNKNFINKLGWNIDKELKLTVSKTRFTLLTGLERPFEGDIILLGLVGGIFEITGVDFEDSFYQTGVTFVWNITARQWNYSHEQLETGNPVIDSVAVDFLNDADVVNDPLADNDTIDTKIVDFLDTTKTGPLTQ